MSRTFHDLGSVWLALLCFAPFLLPPGYLLAHALNLHGFRAKSLSERLLWAVALSVPLAILWTVLAGRTLGTTAVARGILCAAALWLCLLGWQAAQKRLGLGRPNRWTLWMSACMFAGTVYTTLATLGITVGHKLYEGTYAGDWSVRIPLTAAAIHGGVPIQTPFYGVFGQTTPLRYYYFWYVLCGAVGRLGHLDARPVLAASAAWSAFALVAALLLLGKYLFGWTSSPQTGNSLRRLCVLALPVSCILGLDILPAIAGLLLPHPKLYPEMEWWRSQGDFSLSFHTAVLYAPHHTAGLACCALGFLLLTLAARHAAPLTPWRTIVTTGAVAGICFAAAVGTSTYLTLIFTLAALVLVLERAQQRDWRAIAALLLAAAVALPLSSTYLGEVLHGAGATLQSESAHIHGARFVALFPRNVGLPRIELLQIGYQVHYNKLTPFWVKALLRPPMTLLLFAIELGFFGFVLVRRASLDLRHPTRLTVLQRMQWTLFAALAFAALCLTSQPVIGVNDLGRHAGLALRFIAVLWATPMVAEALQKPRFWPLPTHPNWMRAVYATVILGLCSQLWQVTVQRTYFWLVDRGTIAHPFAPFPRFPHYGTRYFDRREAFEAIDRALPPNSRIQMNPASTDWTLATDYLQRPVAAFDTDCEAAFGGDLAQCHRAMPQLRGIFGGGHFLLLDPRPFDPTAVTPAAFDRICSEHHLRALVATASDRVWPDHTSWVWTRPKLFANNSVRVIVCNR